MTQAVPAQAGEKAETENPKNLVLSVTKAFAVLRAFGAELPELTMAEVAARAELDRGTAFRLIRTLVSLGYLAAVPGTRRFRLTLKCLELGFTALSARGLPAHAAPLLRELVPSVADAGSLGMLEAGEVIYLERVQSTLERHGVLRRPGTRIGAYATALGHAMLAFLPAEEQVRHLESVQRIKLSERTLTELNALVARLRAVRNQGYAVSDGENAYGLRTVAAPVLGQDGRPFAGVSLTVTADRMPLAEFVVTAVPQVQRVAQALADGVRLSRGAIGLTDAA